MIWILLSRSATFHRTTFLRFAVLVAVLGTATPVDRAWSQSAAHANVVTVITHDFAFEMPDAIPAGLTTFRLRNAGKQPHHLMFYRLDSGKRISDVFTALNAGGAHPAWMHPAGGPNAVPPGAEAVGSLVLYPGTYVAFCHVKSPDRILHFAKGMMKMVVVTPAPRSEPLPQSDIVITLTDYHFTFSHPPTRGHHLIAVTNRGTQPHELILSKLAEGKTSRDFVHWMDTQDGPPPVVPYGGTTDLPPGGAMLIEVDFKPGTYSAVCRVRDAKDGQPHDRHGMLTDFVVQ
ncbi:MAG: hypothetical protein ACR2NS_10600 [Gemmatimonadaceae bacterium]